MAVINHNWSTSPYDRALQAQLVGLDVLDFRRMNSQTPANGGTALIPGVGLPILTAGGNAVHNSKNLLPSAAAPSVYMPDTRDDRVSLGPLPDRVWDGDGLTVTGWCQVGDGQAIEGNTPLVSIGAQTGMANGFYLQTNPNGSVSLLSRDGGTTSPAASTLSWLAGGAAVGRSFHYAVVVDTTNNTLALYIDGAEITSTSGAGTATNDISSVNYNDLKNAGYGVGLGGTNWNNTYSCEAWHAETLICAEPLTGSKIAALYAAAFLGGENVNLTTIQADAAQAAGLIMLKMTGTVAAVPSSNDSKLSIELDSSASTIGSHLIGQQIAITEGDCRLCAEIARIESGHGTRSGVISVAAVFGRDPSDPLPQVGNSITIVRSSAVAPAYIQRQSAYL